jgi:hypothetical protein
MQTPARARVAAPQRPERDGFIDATVAFHEDHPDFSPAWVARGRARDHKAAESLADRYAREARHRSGCVAVSQ